MKTYFLSLLLLLIFSGMSFAQSPLEESIKDRNYSDSWTLLNQVENTKLYYLYTDCSGTDMSCCELVFFKIENTNNRAVTANISLKLGWKADINGSVTSTDVKKISLSIPANSSIESSCSEEVNDLILYIRELSLPDSNVLSSIKISEFEID